MSVFDFGKKGTVKRRRTCGGRLKTAYVRGGSLMGKNILVGRASGEKDSPGRDRPRRAGEKQQQLYGE